MPKGEFEWERSVDRTQKEDWVANMRQSFSEAELVVVTHYIGLNVAELTDFRAKAREVGATFKVTKNRLAKRALAGTRFEGLCDMFAGPTAVACSNDPVAAAKVAADFAKKNDKLVIIGGALGENVLDRSGVAALADFPSLDELRARIVGALNAPATKVAGVLQAPAGRVARVVGAYGCGEAA